MASVDQGLTADAAPEKKKSSKLFILVLIVMTATGVAGGYFGSTLGLIPAAEFLTNSAKTEDRSLPPGMPDIAFIEVPTLTITMPPGSQSRTLRFSSQIEVPAQYEEDVRRLMPRILDLLNGYLRALDGPDIEKPGALLMLRAQMLHRVMIIVGEERVNSLLVTEFVLN